jgi:hypothetical protein
LGALAPVEQSLARDMIGKTATEAVIVARNNASPQRSPGRRRKQNMDPGARDHSATSNSRMTDMYISLADSRTNGFRNWSKDHPASNDDDNPGGATPIAIVETPADRGALEELRHRPWGIPGVGGAF